MFASADVLKLIAEENMSNLSVVLPSHGSAAHWAVLMYRLENLRYIHSVMPELLSSVDSLNRTPIHFLTVKAKNSLHHPLSVASDLLRFLLRHCPSLACAKDYYGRTLYDLLSAKEVGLSYARRLLLLAGASSLYPGVLQEMNYAARREALLLFHSCVTRPSIYSRIRFSVGGPELMRTIISFL